MISKKTLFILGAGASMPYQLPSGAQLRSALCKLDQEGSLAANVLKRLGLAGSQQLSRFAQEFRQSKQGSIDTFLSNRQDLSDFGKLCIAAELCLKEIPHYIHNADVQDDWYLTLWKEMQNGAKCADDVTKNSVRFVTFNYDRSLEFFLHEATRNSFLATSHEDSFSAWSQIPITHVYGMLGGFSWKFHGELRPYGLNREDDEMNGYAINMAAKGLRVIPEVRNNDETFKKIEDDIRWAEQICILGFSFDPLNMERIGIKPILENIVSSNNAPPKVIATTLGLTQTEKTQIFNTYFSRAIQHEFLSTECQMALRESSLFL